MQARKEDDSKVQGRVTMSLPCWEEDEFLPYYFKKNTTGQMKWVPLDCLTYWQDYLKLISEFGTSFSRVDFVNGHE